jgi:hypothetical protein
MAWHARLTHPANSGGADAPIDDTGQPSKKNACPPVLQWLNDRSEKNRKGAIHESAAYV